MKKAIYAGSFDPITMGHIWVIDEGLKLFDEIVVLVAVNSAKTPRFSLEERVQMIEAVFPNHPRIAVDSLVDQFVVDYAVERNIGYLLRGLRDETDLRDERTINNVNRNLNDEITSVYLMPPPEILSVSSSMVKSLVSVKGWERAVRTYVPPVVVEKFKEQADGTRTNE